MRIEQLAHNFCIRPVGVSSSLGWNSSLPLILLWPVMTPFASLPSLGWQPKSSPARFVPFPIKRILIVILSFAT